MFYFADLPGLEFAHSKIDDPPSYKIVVISPYLGSVNNVTLFSPHRHKAGPLPDPLQFPSHHCFCPVTGDRSYFKSVIFSPCFETTSVFFELLSSLPRTFKNLSLLDLLSPVLIALNPSHFLPSNPHTSTSVPKRDALLSFLVLAISVT